MESKSRFLPLQKNQVKLCFSWQALAAAVMLCCGHSLTDPPRHVVGLQVVTLVPSVGDKVSLCTLGEKKWFRVRLGLEGYQISRGY